MKCRVGLILIAFLLCIGQLQAEVTVVRADALIEQKTFDPRNPPSQMPKLHGNESAVTESEFQIDTHAAGPVTAGPKDTSGQATASVRVENIRMTLRLRVTIWVPINASPKTINHEQGHRRIAEHFYALAEQAARNVAGTIIGQTFSTRGASEDAASSAALDALIRLAGKEYLQKTDVPCGKAQEIYDQITEHGTNAIKEDAAIEQAIAQVESP